MTPTFAVVKALLRKDLLVELRTRESVVAMALFCGSAYVLFHFGLDRDALDGDLAAGVLVVTLLFSAVLGINRLFVAEVEQGGLDGFLLAPVDRVAMFVAKALALLLYLVAVELVAIPLFALLLLEPDPLPVAPQLALILLLADVGIAVVGTLVSGLAVRTRSRDLLGPLLTLPLLVPVAISTAEALSPVLAEGGADWPEARWLVVLLLYDLTFGLLALGVFDPLLED